MKLVNLIFFVSFWEFCFLTAQGTKDSASQQQSRNTSKLSGTGPDNTSAGTIQQDQRTTNESVTKVVEQLLNLYDAKLRPSSGTGFPDQVLVDLVILAIVPISEVNMEFTTTFYIRNYWVDHRLAYGNLLTAPQITMVGDTVNKIWTPDIVFENDLSDHVTRRNYLLSLTRNGSITYSIRKRVRAYCPMEFHEFPLDEQNCELSFESFAFNMAALNLKWRSKKPVVVSNRLKLANYQLVSWKNKGRINTYEHTGSFTSLYVEFVFKRNIGFYVIQIFIPAALIVAISWVSFWIDERSVPARVSLGITTVLAITTLLFGVQSSMPKVGHVKAIDVYLLGNFLFVFGALVEYSIICYLRKCLQLSDGAKIKLKKNSKVETFENGCTGTYTSTNSPRIGAHSNHFMNSTENVLGTTTRKRDNTLTTPGNVSSTQLQEQNLNEQSVAVNGSDVEPIIENGCTCTIDQVSRVLFPALYAVFIIVYLVYYQVLKFT